MVSRSEGGHIKLAVNYLSQSPRRFWEWLTFADYDAAKEQAVSDVITRYSRRNVSSQNGWVWDEDGLADLSSAGGAATKDLKNMISKR